LSAAARVPPCALLALAAGKAVGTPDEFIFGDNTKEQQNRYPAA